MNETELMNRPLLYEENGYIGITKMDGTSILLPNRYVCKRNPYCCPDFSDWKGEPVGKTDLQIWSMSDGWKAL